MKEQGNRRNVGCNLYFCGVSCDLGLGFSSLSVHLSVCLSCFSPISFLFWAGSKAAYSVGSEASLLGQHWLVTCRPWDFVAEQLLVPRSWPVTQGSRERGFALAHGTAGQHQAPLSGPCSGNNRVTCPSALPPFLRGLPSMDVPRGHASAGPPRLQAALLSFNAYLRDTILPLQHQYCS